MCSSINQIYSDGELLRLSEARYNKLRKDTREMYDLLNNAQLENIQLRIKIKNIEELTKCKQ